MKLPAGWTSKVAAGALWIAGLASVYAQMSPADIPPKVLHVIQAVAFFLAGSGMSKSKENGEHSTLPDVIAATKAAGIDPASVRVDGGTK